MYKSKKILGTMAVDMQTGRCFGRVRNIVPDLEQKKLAAVILPGKSWLYPPIWIDFKYVQGLGTDALTLDPQTKVVSCKEVTNFKEHLEKGIRKMWGLMVISTGGNLRGYVEDLFVRIPGGIIEGLELSRGVIGDVLEGRGFVPAEQIVSLSMECVIVEEES